MTFSTLHGVQSVTTKTTGIRNASGIVNTLLEAKYSSCEQCTEHLAQFFSNSASPPHAVFNSIWVLQNPSRASLQIQLFLEGLQKHKYVSW